MEPQSFSDVFVTITQTAQAAGAAAEPLLSDLTARIDAVRQRTEGFVKPADRPRVAFIEWLDPPFQGGHWMPELIETAGGIDLLGVPREHSSTITWQQVLDAKPDLIFVSCCGFPIARTLRDLEALQSQPFWQELVAGAHRGVFVSDGNAYFARPGPRLVESLEIMAHACHPNLHPKTPAAEKGLMRIA